MGEIREKTLAGVKWTAIEAISLRVIQFAIGLIVARILSPSDYGIIGMLTIFTAVASIFVDSGMTNALIRTKDVSSKDCSTVFYFNIVVSIGAYIILFISAPWIADFYNVAILKDIIRVIGINLVIGAFGSVQITRLTIALNFKIQTKITTSCTIACGILAVILAYSGFGVWTLVYQQVAYTASSTILFWLCSKWHPLLEFSKESFNRLFGFGSRLLFSGLINTTCANISTLLIGKFYSAKELGFYSRGSQWPSLVVNITTGILGKVTLPIFSKIQDDKEKLIGVYRKYTKVTSMLIFFSLILLLVLAKPLVLFLLTSKWAPSIIFIQICCVTFMPDHLNQLNTNLLMVAGRSDLLLKIEIIKKSIMLILIFLSINFGVIALCLALLLYSQIAFFINSYYIGKLFDYGYFKQIIDIARYVAYSLLCCLPAYILTYSTTPDVVQIIFGGLLSITLYGALLFVINDVIFKEYFWSYISKFYDKKKA